MTQARMTRLEFDNGLRRVREYLVTMTGTVTEAIQAATTALLDEKSGSGSCDRIAGARTGRRSPAGRAVHIAAHSSRAAGGK